MIRTSSRGFPFLAMRDMFEMVESYNKGIFMLVKKHGGDKKLNWDGLADMSGILLKDLRKYAVGMVNAYCDDSVKEFKTTHSVHPAELTLSGPAPGLQLERDAYDWFNGKEN